MAAPLYACIHLPPSPGCTGFLGRTHALECLDTAIGACVDAGVDGLLLENENDKPHRIRVSTPQAVWLSWLATEARARTRLPLGVGIQRFDVEATLSIAAAADLDFVRLDTFVDPVRMQGETIEPDAREIRELRRALLAERIQIFADVHVKHAEHLGTASLSSSVNRAIEEGAAAVLITSDRTGTPPLLTDLDEAMAAARKRVGIWIASGLDVKNARALRPHADGAIVGTALKKGDRIDRQGALELVRTWRQSAS